MRIAIDIDSTLHQYWDQFREVVNRRYGVDLPYEEQVTWGVIQLEPEQVKLCVQETHGERYVLTAEPYPGAVEAIRRWHEAGHFIHITSHRAADAHAVTARWLAQLELPYDDLYCSCDKVARAAELGIDLLIDDSPVNLQRAAEHGIKGATLTHPWNRDLCARPDIICAPDWPALGSALKPLLEPTEKAA